MILPNPAIMSISSLPARKFRSRILQPFFLRNRAACSSPNSPKSKRLIITETRNTRKYLKFFPWFRCFRALRLLPSCSCWGIFQQNALIQQPSPDFVRRTEIFSAPCLIPLFNPAFNFSRNRSLGKFSNTKDLVHSTNCRPDRSDVLCEKILAICKLVDFIDKLEHRSQCSGNIQIVIKRSFKRNNRPVNQFLHLWRLTV